MVSLWRDRGIRVFSDSQDIEGCPDLRCPTRSTHCVSLALQSSASFTALATRGEQGCVSVVEGETARGRPRAGPQAQPGNEGLSSVSKAELRVPRRVPRGVLYLQQRRPGHRVCLAPTCRRGSVIPWKPRGDIPLETRKGLSGTGAAPGSGRSSAGGRWHVGTWQKVRRKVVVTQVRSGSQN